MEEVNLKPRVPTKAVCAEHLELREILTWFNLQKQALNRAGSKSGKKGAEAALIGPHASRNSFESNLFSKLDKLNQANGDYNAKLGVTILEDLELSKNSKKLVINAYEGLASSECSNVFLPGDNDPYWLANIGEGHSVYFTVPEDCHMKGMTLCVVYLSTPENTAIECLNSVLMVNYTKCTMHIYKRDTVISFDDEDWRGIISHLGPGDEVEIFVIFGNGLVVKKTAVYLMCDESIYMEMEPFLESKKEASKNAFVRFLKKIVRK